MCEGLGRKAMNSNASTGYGCGVYVKVEEPRTGTPSSPPTTTISDLAMSSNIPAELWQHICNEITDRSSLLQASQVSHSWRADIIPRLFESITFNTMGGPWQRTRLESNQGLRFIIPLVRRVVVVALHQKSPRYLWPSDFQQISSAIKALPSLKAVTVQAVRVRDGNDLLMLVGPAQGTSRDLELSLVDVVFGGIQINRPEDEPETDIISLALSESSWQLLRLFSSRFNISRTHLRRLQITFVRRHNMSFLYGMICKLASMADYNLLELALELRSLKPGIQLGKLISMAAAAKQNADE
jgi:hypothetical protein